MVAPAPIAATVGVEDFFTASLGRALELGIATPEDVLAHATPAVLAEHLPREEWTKLLRACLAAPRLDARLVVDTVTVPVLCEHVPFAILWACLAQLATRALGRGLIAAPPPPAVVTPIAVAAPTTIAAPAPAPMTSAMTPPPAPMPATSASPPPAPMPTTPPALTPTPAPAPLGRAGTAPIEPPPLGDPPPSPRLSTTPGATSRGGSAIGARRPQASASAPVAAPRKADMKTQPPAPKGRASTATDFEIETDLGEAWKKAGVEEQVDDDQLVDWAQSEETMTSGEGVDRKR